MKNSIGLLLLLSAFPLCAAESEELPVAPVVQKVAQRYDPLLFYTIDRFHRQVMAALPPGSPYDSAMLERQLHIHATAKECAFKAGKACLTCGILCIGTCKHHPVGPILSSCGAACILEAITDVPGNIIVPCVKKHIVETAASKLAASKEKIT